MAYEFNRFSPQSFERFVQALAAASTGTRVQIFGAGRDGAREATYEGKCNFSGDDWDGYVVFQAKYHSVLETPAKNAKWLIAEIDRELSKFEDAKRALKRPQYYVMASNVRLSASASNASGKGRGGIDQVTEHLDKWVKRLGMRGAHLWHADTLGALLDVHEGVRTTFSFWVQPGDVLSALLKKLSGPSLSEGLPLYLRNGIRQAREIKTRDIGQAVNRTVNLDEVFVDLPVMSDGRLHGFSSAILQDGSVDEPAISAEDWSGHYAPEKELRKAVGQIMRRAADKFDPQAWYRDDDKVARKGPLANRIVLLGGPGQGKSTIGQFLAQLARARLLSCLKGTLAPETNSAVSAILKRARQEDVPLNGPLRYPFHVELPRFADALSDSKSRGDGLTVLGFLARQFTRLTEQEISPATLRAWLGGMPSILILDGLDEVPPSGNRSEVISAVEALMDDIHESNADCICVVTSRPQGYQDELSPKYWSHWNLAPLEHGDALKLVTRLSKVLVSEESRRVEIISTLDEAAQEEAIAPLMSSPLQVMLLFQLVATHDNIPKDRWTLFLRHYETLRDREIAKGGAQGALIRQFRTQIDRIHFDAGYLLHLRAEDAGSADAYLSISEFTDLVRSQLLRDGYEVEAEELAVDIANIATNRLVFLRCQIDSQVAFDVRSLQEFMAAARLTSSPEAKIVPRLGAIAGRAHWLHVFKIACSKIFGSTGHEALREPVIGLLDSLDAGDRSADERTVKTGGRLALQVLLDGTGISIPLYRRKLVARAIRLLSVADDQIPFLLASIVDLSESELLAPLLVEAMNGGDAGTADQARRLLALLSSRQEDGCRWPSELLAANWPDNSEEAFRIFDALSYLPQDEVLQGLLRASQWSSTPRDVGLWMDALHDEEWDRPIPNGCFIAGRMPAPCESKVLQSCGEVTDLSLTFYSLNSALPLVKELPDGVAPIWHLASAAHAFSENPCGLNAATFLRGASNLDTKDVFRMLPLPWVLAALLAGTSEVDDRERRAVAVENGDHGSLEDWERAEGRWISLGVKQEEFFPRIGVGGIPTDIAVRGAPPFVGRRIRSSRDEHIRPSAAKSLIELVGRVPEKQWPIELLFFYVARSHSPLNEEEIKSIVELSRSNSVEAPKNRWIAAALVRMLEMSNSVEVEVRLLEVLPVSNFPLLRPHDSAAKLAQAFKNNLQSRQLLQPIASSFRYFRMGFEDALQALPKEALLSEPGDDPIIKGSVALLRGISGEILTPDEIRQLLDAGPVFVRPLLQPYRFRDSENVESRLEIARAVLTQRTPKGVLAAANTTLEGYVESRPVSLKSSDVSCSLELPPALPANDRTRRNAA